VCDHNVPTTDRKNGIADPVSKLQVHPEKFDLGTLTDGTCGSSLNVLTMKSVASDRKEPAMIISAPTDYREAAERRLPRFLFDYIDGGAVTERTMQQNVEELASINLRQRVLRGVGTPSLETEIMGQKWALPIALGPVSGRCARRRALWSRRDRCLQ
jgi:hypothetical protein